MDNQPKVVEPWVTKNDDEIEEWLARNLIQLHQVNRYGSPWKVHSDHPIHQEYLIFLTEARDGSMRQHIIKQWRTNLYHRSQSKVATARRKEIKFATTLRNYLSRHPNPDLAGKFTLFMSLQVQKSTIPFNSVTVPPLSPPNVTTPLPDDVAAGGSSEHAANSEKSFFDCEPVISPDVTLVPSTELPVASVPQELVNFEGSDPETADCQMVLRYDGGKLNNEMIN